MKGYYILVEAIDSSLPPINEKLSENFRLYYLSPEFQLKEITLYLKDELLKFDQESIVFAPDSETLVCYCKF